MTKPIQYPEWASDGQNTVDPGASKKTEGWITGEAPASSYTNWLQNKTYNWIKWLDEFTTNIKTQLDTNTASITNIIVTIANLTTTQIKNNSSVNGSTATDALNTLNGLIDGQNEAIATIQLPVGGIMQYAGAPSTLTGKWILCDGRKYDKSEKPELYNAIKTAWNIGGEIGDEFRVPNLAGLTLVGEGVYTDEDGNPYQYNLGDTGGEPKHKLIVEELAKHSHNLHEVSGTGNNNHGVNIYNDNDEFWRNGHISETGGDVPHENRQPYAVINYFIRER